MGPALSEYPERDLNEIQANDILSTLFENATATEKLISAFFPKNHIRNSKIKR